MPKGKTIDMKTLAKRLIAARTRAQMTQEDVAKQAGLQRPTLTLLERGDKPHIRGDTLVGLCRALKVSADYLLGLKDEESETKSTAVELVSA